MKGVQNREDARRAIDCGASAVVVSNHRGRSLRPGRPFCYWDRAQFSLAMAGIVVAALLSTAPAMAQAYNENNTGWNRGGTLKTDTAGKVPMCFKTFGSGKFDGPRLVGTSDAATHGWQNFWGPCEDLNAQASAPPKRRTKARR